MQAPGYSAALFKLTVTGLFANNYHQAGSRQSSNAPDSCWNLPGRHSGNFLEDMIRNLFSLIFRCTCTYMCVFQLIIYIYIIFKLTLLDVRWFQECLKVIVEIVMRSPASQDFVWVFRRVASGTAGTTTTGGACGSAPRQRSLDLFCVKSGLASLKLLFESQVKIKLPSMPDPWPAMRSLSNDGSRPCCHRFMSKQCERSWLGAVGSD